jgi:hypothetical protein
MPSPDYHYEGWTCSVYAVSDGHGNVKVGVARRVDRRIEQMQTGNAHPLQLLFECVIESPWADRFASAAAYRVEHWIHEALSDKRMTGEWFAVDYHEVLGEMEHVIDWFRNSELSSSLAVHDLHVHTYEKDHIWYWPTSDVEERGLLP